MNSRSRIIRWVLILHWPPFTWFFRFCYWLAIRFCGILVLRIDGVKSIYLTGSWARHEVIYGLSDIDFKIFVEGPKRPDMRQSIHRRFACLRRFFPMIGPPDEKGIYFLDSFQADYDHHPLVQHLFDPRFFRHQLLAGDDILPELPVRNWNTLDQGECAFARLRDWIERVYSAAGWDGFTRWQRRHLYFKAATDVALLAHRLRFPECAFSRRSEILEQSLPALEEEYRPLALNLTLENKHLYREELNSDEENFLLFKKMVSSCAQTIAQQDRSQPVAMTIPFRAEPCRCGDPAVPDSLRLLSPRIREVRTVRRPHLPLNPFDMRCFNTPLYLVDCAGPLNAEEFRAMKEYFMKAIRNKGTVLLKEDPFFLSSPDSELVDHWASFPGSSDLAHLLLLENRNSITTLEHARVETRLSAFLQQLETSLSDARFGRLDPALFAAFLFNAVRVLIFCCEFRLGKWRWMLTPEEITEFLLEHTPMQAPFLRALLEQYHRTLGNGTPFNERLLPKCRAMLAEMLKIARNGVNWDSLSVLNGMADETRLSVAVAIVTANRQAQLKRCLDSIARLDRVPEELFIVSSGCEPDTWKAVEQASLSCPVRYLQCDQRGVAQARNMAAQACSCEIVAFVDDDACVAPDWLEHIERIFLRDSQAGIVAGSISNMQCGRKDMIWRFMEAVEKSQI